MGARRTSAMLGRLVPCLLILLLLLIAIATCFASLDEWRHRRRAAAVDSGTLIGSTPVAMSGALDTSNIEQETQVHSKQQTQSSLNQEPLCRIETGAYLTFEAYRLETCARCYNYMPPISFKPNAQLKLLPTSSLMPSPVSLLIEPDASASYMSNDTQALAATFKSVSLCLKWQQCCADAIECCLKTSSLWPSFSLSLSSPLLLSTPATTPSSSDRMMTSAVTRAPTTTPITTTTTTTLTTSLSSSSLNSLINIEQQSAQCPSTWDGWSCWEGAPASSERHQECPNHIFVFDDFPCKGLATKKCTTDGQWYRRHDREWTDYVHCSPADIHIFRVYYSIFTLLTSIVAIVPALIIFNYYEVWHKSERISIHKNLLFALLVHAILTAILKWTMLRSNSGPAKPDAENFCLIISVGVKYMRTVGYFWMFNEALYLHLRLKVAPRKPYFRPLCLAAYLCPFVLVAVYSVVRFWLTYTENFEPWLTRIFSGSLTKSSTINSNSSTVDASSLSADTLSMSSAPFDIISDSDSSADPLAYNLASSVNENTCWILPLPQYESIEWIINFPNLILFLANCTFLGLLLRTMCNLQRLPIASHSGHMQTSNGSSQIANCRTSSSNSTTARYVTINQNSTSYHHHNDQAHNNHNHHDQNNDNNNSNNNNNYNHNHNHHTQTTVTTRVGPVSSSLSSSSGVGFGAALRAACLLLPLYGLHFMVIVIRPNIEICWLAQVYAYFSISVDGFQGLFVAVLFCYATREVRLQLARTIRGHNWAAKRNNPHDITELYIT